MKDILERVFCKDHLSEHLQKISCFHVFLLRKIIFHFPSKEQDHIFGETKHHIFLMIQEGSYSSAIVLKDYLFGAFAKIHIFLFFSFFEKNHLSLSV